MEHEDGVAQVAVCLDGEPRLVEEPASNTLRCVQRRVAASVEACESVGLWPKRFRSASSDTSGRRANRARLIQSSWRRPASSRSRSSTI